MYARGGVSPLANGMATGADWMSAASFICSYAAGMHCPLQVYVVSVIFEMGWTGGYVLLAITSCPPYLRKFWENLPYSDFIGDRYYSNTARMVAVICALICFLLMWPDQMRAGGRGPSPGFLQ